MKKWRFYPILVVVLFCLAGGSVNGAPTLNGPTGMITLPTADCLGQGRFDLSLHQWEDLSILGFNLGVANALEAGINVRGWRGRINNAAYIKYCVMPGRGSQTGVAVGAETRSEDNNSFYITASKYLSELEMRGHIGMGVGRYHGFFLGASKTLKPIRGNFPQTILMGEMVAGNLNVGARLQLSPEVNLNFALMDLEDFVFGLSFSSSF